MITAALPTYNNANAISIQLEALCNQQDAPEWELIVCEEPSEKYFGKKKLSAYVSRLKAANCKRIVYVGLNKWCPLGEKWVIIRDKMASDSVGMMLCASDNYSPATRVKDSYEAMTAGHDWYQCNSGHFFDVHTHKAGLFKVSRRSPALFMCIAPSALKGIKQTKYPKRGVDTWLYTTAKIVNPKYDEYTKGVHTDGVNTISLGRKRQYIGETAKGFFTEADSAEVFALFSKEVQDYINTLKA